MAIPSTAKKVFQPAIRIVFSYSVLLLTGCNRKEEAAQTATMDFSQLAPEQAKNTQNQTPASDVSVIIPNMLLNALVFSVNHPEAVPARIHQERAHISPIWNRP